MNRLSLAALAACTTAMLLSTACDGGEEVAAADAPAAAPADPAAAPPAAPATAGAPAARGPQAWPDDVANPEWTCGAFCMASFTCSANGDSRWDKTFRTSVGRTAAEAFQNLYAKCHAEGAEDIVKGFHCMGADPLYDWASLADACVKTR